MNTPRDLSEDVEDRAAAARLLATRATAGSADDIFGPGYVNRLRADWPE